MAKSRCAWRHSKDAARSPPGGNAASLRVTTEYDVEDHAWRLFRGPGLPDRILALDTLFVSAIALLVLFGMYLGTAVYFEAALIIAMLGFVGTVVLSKYVLRRDIVE